MQWTNSADWLKRIPSEFFSERLLWRVFHLFLLSAVVVLLVVSCMSWLETKLRPPVRVEASAATSTKQEGADRDSQQQSLSLQQYRSAIDKDIFGAVDESEEEEEVSIEDIPLSEKELHLKLVGTILRESPQESIAVIEDTRTGEQEMYRVGDRIDQVTIESILRSNVVIASSEGKKVLTMEYESLRSKSGQQKSVGDRSSSRASSSTTRSISKDFVQQSLQDMSGLMQSALIRPYQQGGETVGFQLDNIQSGSFYDRIGLKDGDVIMSVGDMEMKSPQQLMEFSQELRTRSQVTMTLRRNGQKRQIEYRLR